MATALDERRFNRFNAYSTRGYLLFFFLDALICINGIIQKIANSTVQYAGKQINPLVYMTLNLLFWSRRITTKKEIRKIWPTKLFPEEEEYLDSLKSELEELDKRLEELALQNATVKKDLAENRAVLDNISPRIEAVPSQPTQDTQSTLPEPRQNRQFSFQSRISMEGEVNIVKYVYVTY